MRVRNFFPTPDSTRSSPQRTPPRKASPRDLLKVIHLPKYLINTPPWQPFIQSPSHQFLACLGSTHPLIQPPIPYIAAFHPFSHPATHSMHGCFPSHPPIQPPIPCMAAFHQATHPVTHSIHDCVPILIELGAGMPVYFGHKFWRDAHLLHIRYLTEGYPLIPNKIDRKMPA